MTVREIQAHLEEMQEAELSPSLIAAVINAVIDEIKDGQAKPPCPVYPIVYFDCIHVKVREGEVRIKAVHLAIGLTLAGEKEVIGFGWRRPRAPSSGCRWPPNCITAACRPSSLPASTV